MNWYLFAILFVHFILAQDCETNDYEQALLPKQFQYFLDDNTFAQQNFDEFDGFGFWSFSAPLLTKVWGKNIQDSYQSNQGNDGDMIFMIQKIGTDQIFCIGYQSFNYITREVNHNIRILDNNQQEIESVNFNFPALLYEGRWIFHLLTFENTSNNQFSLNIEVSQNDQQKIQTMGDFGFNVQLGGQGNFFNMNLRTFQGRLSKLIYKTNSDDFQQLTDACSIPPRSPDPQIVNIVTGFKNFEGTEEFRKYFEHFGFSYYISGWVKFKVLEKNQEFYTLLRLSGKYIYGQEQNLGDELLVYQVELQKSQPINSRIIVSADAYSIPQVQSFQEQYDKTFQQQINQNYDVYQNKKIIQNSINDDLYNGLTEWHFLEYEFMDNQVGNKMHLKISFIQQQQTIDLFLGNDIFQGSFTNSYFYLNFGGDDFNKNYIKGQIFDFSIQFNYQENQIQVDSIRCHYTCLTCDGPYETNCLSCIVEQNRYYLSEQKICKCNENCIEFSDGSCKNYLEFFPSLVFEDVESSDNNYCQVGEFRLPNSFDSYDCNKCPIGNYEGRILCVDCILQSKTWYLMPVCKHDLIKNTNEEFAPYFMQLRNKIDYEVYLIGNDRQLNLFFQFEDFCIGPRCVTFKYIHLGEEAQLFCKEGFMIDDINEDCIRAFDINCADISTGQNSCFNCNPGYYSDGYHCQLCPISCKTCDRDYWDGTIACTSCIDTYSILDGDCVSCGFSCTVCVWEIDEIALEQQKCFKCKDDSKYYVSLTGGDCKMRMISNCLYSVEILSYDYSINSIDQNYELQDETYSILEICARCESGYMYIFEDFLCVEIKNQECDFGIGQFVKQLNDYELKECLISSDQESSIPSVQFAKDCNLYIKNCISCLETDEKEKYFCLQCQQGYYASKLTGDCILCPPDQFCYTCFQQDTILESQWKTEIRAFYKRFIESTGGHQFAIFGQSQEIDDYSIYCSQCQEGYRLHNYQCIPYCNNDCQDCIFLDGKYACIKCYPVGQNKYPLILDNNKCIECAPNCALCISRSDEEIYSINPLFNSSAFAKYSYHCLKPFQDINSYYNEDWGLFITCDQSLQNICKKQITIKLKLYEDYYSYQKSLNEISDPQEKIIFQQQNIYLDMLKNADNQFSQFQNPKFYEIANRLGVQKLIINLYTENPDTYYLFSGYTIEQKFSQNIFTLREVEFELTLLNNEFCFYFGIKLINFSKISFLNSNFLQQDTLKFQFISQFEQVIIFKQLKITQQYLPREYNLLLIFSNIKTLEIDTFEITTLAGLNTNLFDIKSYNEDIKVSIKNFKILNSLINNGCLFSFQVSQQAIINFENIFIQSAFYDAKIFNFQSQLDGLIIQNVQIVETSIQNSDDVLDFSIVSYLICKQIILQDVTITNSSLLISQSALFQNTLISNCKLYGNSKIFYNYLAEDYPLNITFQNISFQDNCYYQIGKFMHFKKQLSYSILQLQNITILNNYLVNSSIISNSIQENFSLILIELDEINIQKYQIERGPGVYDFFFKNITKIELYEGLITQTKFAFKGLHQNLDCLLRESRGNQYQSSLLIFSVGSLKVSNLVISNVQVFDYPLISYISANANENNFKSTFYFENIVLKESVLLLTESISPTLSFLSFLCNNENDITFVNARFEQNIFHLYEQNSFENLAALITVTGQQNTIKFESSLFKENFVTNGSCTLLFLSGQELVILNSQFFNNSLFLYDILSKNLIWGYEKQQQVYLETVKQIFEIKSQAGIGLLRLNQILFDFIIVQNTQGYMGGCFSIETKNTSLITINNSQFISVNTLFQQDEENGGLIYISSAQNFMISIEFLNSNMSQIYCKSLGGLLYLSSFSSKVTIQLENLFLNDIYAMIGSIIYFSSGQQSSAISVNQIEFTNSFIGYLTYLNFYKFNLRANQIMSLMNNRTLFYLENCQSLSFINILMSELTYESIMNCKNTTNLFVSKMQVLDSNLISYLLRLTSNKDQFSVVQINDVQFVEISFGLSIETKNCSLPDTNFPKNKFVCLAETQDRKPPNLLEYFIKDPENQFGYCLLLSMKDVLDSSETGFIELLEFSDQSLIQFTNVIIESITCELSKYGLIFVNYLTEKDLLTQKFQSIKIINSSCGEIGCISIVKTITNSTQLLQFNNVNSYELVIQNYECQLNQATQGTCLTITSVRTQLQESQFFQNTASGKGGAIYFKGKQIFIIENTLVQYNSASIGGGLFLESQSQLKYELLNTIINRNQAEDFGHDVVSTPNALTFVISGQQQLTQNLKFTNTEVIDIINPNLQGYLMVPTGQPIYSYQFFDFKTKNYISLNLSIRLIALGQDKDVIKKLADSSCTIYGRQIKNDYDQVEFTENFTNFQTIEFDSQTQSYNLEEMIVYFDNNSSSTYLQLEFQCNSIQVPIFSKNYPYQIQNIHSNYKLRANFKTYQCQFGEIKTLIKFSCQNCNNTLGFYQLKLNQQKCDIIDEISTISIQNNQLQLRKYYWRPYFDSSEVTYCLNLPQNCLGGIIEGDNSCYIGHIGAMCEQCDLYDIRGKGHFSISDQYSCGSCQDQSRNTIFIVITIVITQIFLFASVNGNLKNIEQNQRQKSVQKILQAVYFQKTQESILVKMLTNYLQIVTTITKFQLQVPSTLLRTIDSFGNPIQTSTYSLDCFLALYFLEIQYDRMIWQIILPFIYINIFFLLYSATTKLQLTSFNSSVISTTFIYIFIYFQSNLVGGFIQLISYRKISGFKWIQANVAQRYDTIRHYEWILKFCLPMILILAIVIPAYLFFILHKNKDKLEKKSIKLRWGSSLFLGTHQNNLKDSNFVVFKLLLRYYYHQRDIELNSNYQPYNLSMLNQLDYLSTNTCMITVGIAVGAYMTQITLNYELTIPFFVAIAYLNLSFLFQILTKILEQYLRAFETILDILREKIKQKFPSLNKGFCAKVLKNRSKQRQRVIKRFQKIKSILIPLVQKSIQIRAKNLVTQQTSKI